MIRRRQARAGYTILELMVVIVIILILAALVAPSLLGFWGNNRTKAAADIVSARLADARGAAISHGIPYRVAASPDGTQVRVGPDEAAVAVHARVPLGYAQKVPPDELDRALEAVAPGVALASIPRVGAELRGLALSDLRRSSGLALLLVIGVVALIVIGPQKLPRVARTAGILMGRLQRYVSDVKADINREIELDELRKMRDSMQKAASDMQSSVDSELSKTADELNKAVEGEKPAEPPKTGTAAQ